MLGGSDIQYDYEQYPLNSAPTPWVEVPPGDQCGCQELTKSAPSPLGTPVPPNILSSPLDPPIIPTPAPFPAPEPDLGGVVFSTLTTGNNNIDFRRPGTATGMRTTVDENATVRMGRWMSQSEYDDMVSTGKVQIGSEGEATYVLLDGPDGFETQARSGSVYAEFDVPANNAWWMTNDDLGWATIPAPGSSQANRWRIVTGQDVDQMPTVTNITDILRRK